MFLLSCLNKKFHAMEEKSGIWIIFASLTNISDGTICNIYSLKIHRKWSLYIV